MKEIGELSWSQRLEGLAEEFPDNSLYSLFFSRNLQKWAENRKSKKISLLISLLAGNFPICLTAP
jgi:hypothetical protein